MYTHLLAVCVISAVVGIAVGQPCRICGPSSEAQSCTPNDPLPAPLPDKIQIQSTICDEIENNHKDYHNKLCEKYPKPNGYYYECTTPGTTSTFSCRSSCGPPLEDVGKGLNLDLLKGGSGLFATLNNGQNRGSNLFDFNNFNNDQQSSTGNANFGNLGSLGNFDLLNNQGQFGGALGGASSQAGGNKGGKSSFTSSGSSYSGGGGGTKTGSNVLNFGNSAANSNSNQGLGSLGNSNQGLNTFGNANQALSGAAASGSDQGVTASQGGYRNQGQAGNNLGNNVGNAVSSSSSSNSGSSSSSNSGSNNANNALNNNNINKNYNDVDLFDAVSLRNGRSGSRSSNSNNNILQDVFGSGQAQSSSKDSAVGGLGLFGPSKQSFSGSSSPFNLAGSAAGNNNFAFNFGSGAGNLPSSPFAGGGQSFGRSRADVNGGDFMKNFDVTVLKPVDNQNDFDGFYNNFNANFEDSFNTLGSKDDVFQTAGAGSARNKRLGLAADGAATSKALSRSARAADASAGSALRPERHGHHPVTSEGALQPFAGREPRDKSSAEWRVVNQYQPSTAAPLRQVENVQGEPITQTPPGVSQSDSFGPQPPATTEGANIYSSYNGDSPRAPLDKNVEAQRLYAQNQIRANSRRDDAHNAVEGKSPIMSNSNKIVRPTTTVASVSATTENTSMSGSSNSPTKLTSQQPMIGYSAGKFVEEEEFSLPPGANTPVKLMAVERSELGAGRGEGFNDNIVLVSIEDLDQVL